MEGCERSSRKKSDLCRAVTQSTLAQRVERATHGEEVLGSIPSVDARSLLVGSVSVTG